MFIPHIPETNITVFPRIDDYLRFFMYNDNLRLNFFQSMDTELDYTTLANLSQTFTTKFNHNYVSFFILKSFLKIFLLF